MTTAKVRASATSTGWTAITMGLLVKDDKPRVLLRHEAVDLPAQIYRIEGKLGGSRI
jgi:hypothetical protein